MFFFLPYYDELKYRRQKTTIEEFRKFRESVNPTKLPKTIITDEWIKSKKTTATQTSTS